MKSFAKVLGALLVAGALTVSAAQAGNVLFFYGHSGLNEGHTQFEALLAGVGCTVDENSNPTLPTLVGSGYNLVLISVPGLTNPNDFFSASEKADVVAWLAQTETHRVVLIGEWDGFYGQGQQVLIDLLTTISGGTGISFIPGVFDSGCFAYDCAGTLSGDPLVAGLGHVCKAATSVWNQGNGAAVAFPFENPDQPWIVSNGTTLPCIVGIGDSNTLSDGCGHLGDNDTATFAKRLCQITCGGHPVPTQETTWGVLKSIYR